MRAIDGRLCGQADYRGRAMKESGLVTKIDGNTAYVLFERTSACAKCGACGMISGQNDITVTMENALHAREGERVEVQFQLKMHCNLRRLLIFSR